MRVLRRFFLGGASVFLAFPVSLWAWFHERRIVRRGRQLTESEIADAQAVGVRRPERLRILAVREVPNPLSRLAGLIDRWTRYSVFSPAGMTLRYGIFALEYAERDRRLLVHEFAHVAQYERLGGRFWFMRRYIFECLANGYAGAALEVEAREVTERVCRSN